MNNIMQFTDTRHSHDLPPAPPAPAAPHVGGPGYSEDTLNKAADVEEHPGSALERELGQGTRF